MLESLFNRVADIRACNFIKKKLQHSCFPVKFAKFFTITYFDEHQRTTASLFSVSFSYHHFHYHHFHYDHKMHLYRLRILLTILLDCSMISCLFQVNFVFFLPAYIFFYSYSKLFTFYVE